MKKQKKRYKKPEIQIKKISVSLLDLGSNFEDLLFAYQCTTSCCPGVDNPCNCTPGYCDCC